MKFKIKIPIHIAICFLITVAIRCGYSYFTKGTVAFGSIFMMTIPIFIVVYVVLYFFMKFLGDLKD